MLAPIEEPRSLPHSEESERAVLAAVMLDSGRHLPTASGRLRVEDFYFDRHQKLFLAMLELQVEGSDIDLRTLQAKLEQKRELDSVGGIAYLASLDVDLPDLGRVESYVEIIKERSLRRRLMSACLATYRSCQDGGLQAREALASAEQSILQLGEEAFPSGFVGLDEIFKSTIVDLEERPDNPFPGLRTGLVDFDTITHGLHPGHLVIIAGRPGMGKTSLALNIAQNVTIREGRVAGIFSLEMGQQELAMRILCSESDVPFSRLRAGRISQREWRRVHDTVRRTRQAKLFVDDAAAATLLEVSSKARRLKLERGLDLVIVDYLQLMQAGGRFENRNLEIGAITRGLKQLAKELEIPVLCLSQLSRQPERRGSDHRPQLADLRESGCLTGETLVSMADTGERVPIRQLAGRQGFAVWALDQELLKLERAVVSAAFSTGRKPVHRLATRLGRTIRATANHRFLALGGWRRLDEMESGDFIALPRQVQPGPSNSLSLDELALLGHLIGDGCTLRTHAIQYTSRDRDLAEHVASLAVRVFGPAVHPRLVRERSWYQVYLSSTRKHGRGRRSAVAEWLDHLGIWDLRSDRKVIPERLFCQGPESIAHFLRHLWATDGCIYMRGGRKPYPAIYYASASRALASGVQALLLRLGICARLKRVPQPGKGRDQFHVVVNGSPDFLSFALLVGAVGERKAAALEEVVTFVRERAPNPNCDVIPKAVWRKLVVPAMAIAGLSQRGVQAKLGMSYCGATLFKHNLSRERGARVAKVVESAVLLRLAQSDLYWDQVESIEPDGVEEVFDLTVPGPHNFLANDIVVHNSIEQDADLVAFVYRDEIYNKEDLDNKGLAELIIAKHRSGETGMIELAFIGDTTSFRNLEKYGAPPPDVGRPDEGPPPPHEPDLFDP